MDEEVSIYEKEPVYVPLNPLIVCKCLCDTSSSEEVFISERKQKILSTVARTENYLRERRIPELIRFLLTKLLSQCPTKPIKYLEKLLSDCMLFRAGHGSAPVLYEDRHLEAVIKSFDPGQRGWLTPGQIRRAFITLGLTPEENIRERMTCGDVLELLRKTQKSDLLGLLSAGINLVHDEDSQFSSTT